MIETASPAAASMNMNRRMISAIDYILVCRANGREGRLALLLGMLVQPPHNLDGRFVEVPLARLLLGGLVQQREGRFVLAVATKLQTPLTVELQVVGMEGFVSRIGRQPQPKQLGRLSSSRRSWPSQCPSY